MFYKILHQGYASSLNSLSKNFSIRYSNDKKER